MTSRQNRSSPNGSSHGAGASAAGSADPSTAKHGPSVRKAVSLTSVRADPGRILAPAEPPAVGAARGEGEETARSRPDTPSVGATDATVPASSGTTGGTREKGSSAGAASSRQQAEAAEQEAAEDAHEQAAPAVAPEAEAQAVTLAAAGGASSGGGTPRGGGEPPSGNQKKPLLAAAGIAGTVLLAVPLLIWATDNSDRKSDKSSVAAESDTLLDDKALDARQGSYAPTEPTTKPTNAKSATAGKADETPSPSTTRSAGAPRPDRTTEPKATKEASGGSTGKPTADKAAHTVNLAQGRSVSADSHVEDFVGSHVTDGDAGTYWESTKGTDAFPHSIRVDLGTEKSISKIVLKLPPVADWNSRTQTLSVWGAHNSSDAFTLASSAGYTFDAATGNSVTIRLSGTATRYIELRFTANSGWPAAQLSELAAY